MNGSDKDISSWDQRLGDQVNRKHDNYVTLRIMLDDARDRQPIGIAGEYIYVKKVSSGSAEATIRLDRNTNDELDLARGAKTETVFRDFYITNTAQAGEWIDLLIGINFKYERPAGDPHLEAQAIVVVTNGSANTNTIPSAQIAERVLIKADVVNTGIVWVNFGTVAAQNACLPLDPGESTQVSLSNLNRINANFEVADERLFIVNEI